MNDNWNTDNQDNNYYRTDNEQRDYSNNEPRSKSRNVFVSYKQDNRSAHPGNEAYYNPPNSTETVYVHNKRPKTKRKYKALKIIIPIFIILAIIGFITSAFEEYDEITKSTVHRQALAEGLVNKTGYLSDETGWLSDKSDTLDGLREFYKKTGVQPYLYVTDSINEYEVPTAEELDVFTSALYDELFTDEAHMLFVFCYHDQSYSACCLRGTQAETVIDDQAANILLDYVDHYYYKDTLDSSFRYVFTKAAGRIMTVTKPPFATAIIVIVVALALGLLYWWWQHNKKKKAKEEQLMEDILDTPLEKFGDLEVEELADKYEDTDESL